MRIQKNVWVKPTRKLRAFNIAGIVWAIQMAACTLLHVNELHAATPLPVQLTSEPRSPALHVTASDHVAATIGKIEFRDCTLTLQGGERDVQCAWWDLPESRSQKQANSIAIFIVRLPASRNFDIQPDPMLFIAGGPGQAASETFLYADHIWSKLALTRDIYLIDQRGTGQSHYFGCENLNDYVGEPATEFDAQLIKKLSRDCLDNFVGDAKAYTTAATVEDLEQVRTALGITQWNLLGVSYGTRVAAKYMRAYPTSVRTVVLDSVVPSTLALGPEIALNSQYSLDALIERCKMDTACARAIPEFEKELAQLFEQLEQAPVTVNVENFTSGEVERLQFSETDLSLLIRLYLYNSKTSALLPPMIHQAASSNNFGPLLRAVQRVKSSVQSALAFGLHNSVLCTEDYPFYKLDEASRRQLRDTYMGTTIVDMFDAICEIWPSEPLTGDARLPLRADVPTLLLSGELDPITPPAYGDMAAAELTNSKHIIVQGQGHFVSAVGCLPQLISEFVHQASSNALDLQCVDRIQTPPLFLNFNGTSP